MSRFLFGFFLAVLVVLALPLVLHPALEGTPVEAGRWVMECLEKKRAIAAQLPGPKIVLSGGSNVLFGYSARQLEDRLQRPVVNGAVQVGLGLDYILHTTRGMVQDGDLIVLSLEYELFRGDWSSSGRNFQVLAHDQAYLRGLPARRRLAMLLTVPPRDYWLLTKARFVPVVRRTTGYQSSNLNDRGDETSNTDEHIVPSRVAALAAAPVDRFTISTYSARELTKFVQDMRQRNVAVAYAFPNIFRGSLGTGENEEFLRRLNRCLGECGLVVLGDPHDATFGIEHTFDTVYHVNREGQRISTGRLGDLLQASGLLDRSRREL